MERNETTARIKVPPDDGGNRQGPGAENRTVKLAPAVPDSETRNAPLSTQYNILKKIGDGGMGVVYLARDTRLGRYVAIKRLNNAAMNQAALKRRFMREARSVAALNHIHIVHVYSLGEDAEGPYIVMEYVAGPSRTPAPTKPPPSMTLADQVHRDGPLTVNDAVTLLVKLCRAIDYAHSCGVIHRDLKPTNVLLDESGEPKIVDFGLARRAGQATGPITVPGERMLSLGYGAPEQESDASTTDERADIYGLGAILYFSVTGQNPRYFRENDVPEAIRMSLVRALKTDREKRWPSVKEFMNSLLLVQAPSTVVVPTLKTTWRCKWCDTINPITLQYCGECGWDGSEECVECGAETRVGVPFCGECGANAREYESVIRLLQRMRAWWEQRDLKRIDQQGGAATGFNPNGPNGRRMVKEIQDLVRRARQGLERRTQLREMIQRELTVRNYERAARYIDEYDALSRDGAFAVQRGQLPALTAERDLERARRALRAGDLRTVEGLTRHVIEELDSTSSEARRLLHAVVGRRARNRFRIAAMSGLCLFFLYVYSGAPVFRLLGRPARGSFYKAYRFVTYLRDATLFDDSLAMYAALWDADGMFRPAPEDPPPVVVKPHPPDPPIAERLMELRTAYADRMEEIQERHATALEEWPGRYETELTELQRQQQQAGDFEAWLAIQDELDRFAANRVIPPAAEDAGLPDFLAALRQRHREMRRGYADERHRNILKATDAYVNELEEWQRGLTRRGQLDSAREVNNEIKRVRSNQLYAEARAAVHGAETAVSATNAASAGP